MIDSLGLLDLVAAIQEFAGREIDFEILDPEEMTIVGPLCRFVSEQVSEHG
jgi:acyl carrier protein